VIFDPEQIFGPITPSTFSSSLPDPLAPNPSTYSPAALSLSEPSGLLPDQSLSSLLSASAPELPTYLSPALSLSSLLSQPTTYTKAKMFVSYHHRLDKTYYDAFSRYVCEEYDVLCDNSPERAKDSDDVEYIMRSLRENHIKGSSCTIVLCGEETRWRKFVDWEIDVTLSMEHGLVVVLLPTCRYGYNNQGTHKPDRLQDNIDSGYAVFTTWQEIAQNGPHFVREKVALADAKSKSLIRNDRPRMLRNGTPPWERDSDTISQSILGGTGLLGGFGGAGLFGTSLFGSK